MSYTKPGEVLERAWRERQEPAQIRMKIRQLEQQADDLDRELFRIYPSSLHPQGPPQHIEEDYRKMAKELREEAQALRDSTGDYD